MKKKVIAFFAIIGLFVSCQKDPVLRSNDGAYNYTFSISNGDSGVRSLLDGNNIVWEAGDAVGMYVGSNVNATATVAAGLTTMSVSFTSPMVADQTLMAYFPRIDGDAATSAIPILIPTAQTVADGVGFDADAMPAVAAPVNVTAAVAAGESNASLSFYNLASVLRFHIYTTNPGITGSIKSVTFTSTGGDNLAGNATFDISAADPASGTLTGLDEASVTVTLATAVALGSAKATAAQVPMVIAPGAYKGTVTVTMADASTFTYDIVKTFSVERSALLPVGIDLARANSLSFDGIGTEENPYIVHNATDLKAKMAEEAKYIKLGSNILLPDSWTSENFNGYLDGDGNTIGGLKVCFTNALTGTIRNVKFVGVEISDYKSSDNCKGVVAQTSAGATIDGVAAYGTMSTSNTNGTSDYSGVGGIVGRASGATTISNCYVEVDIPIVGSNYCVGGILGNIRETNNITISNCTFAGSITGSGNYTKIGGILGRKTNVNQSSNDIIQDCLVSGSIAITGTGSNMVGGVFGALQGGDVSGVYVGGLTIARCAFTGSISAGAAVGGIGGVSPTVVDCFVSGDVQATTTSSSQGSAGVVADAKGAITRCVVAGSRISGTNQTAFSTAGIVCKRNANTPAATYCAVIGATLQDDGKTILGTLTNLSGSNNKWYGVTYINNGNYVSGGTVQDGDAFSSAPAQSDFETLGYDFTDVWKWNAAGYPELRGVGATVR